MRTFISLTAVLILVAGCGQNPDKPVYDTKANPENYPAQACLMLDQIENGQLAVFDSIVVKFGELYTSYPELLDNPQWQQIIERLGVKFRHRADMLADSGLAQYEQAAHLYTLAAFARPNDDRVQAIQAKFATWSTAVADSVVPADLDPVVKPLDISEQLRILRYFLLDDSIHQQFANEFLVPLILNKHAAESAMKAVGPQQISNIDRCFLTTLGFENKAKLDAVTHFSEPSVDLVAAQITAQPHGWYAAELYFLPHDTLTSDYVVALRVGMPNPSAADPKTTIQNLSFDFRPSVGMLHWRPGEIYPAYRRFMLRATVTQVAVGIYDRAGDSTRFVPLRDTGEPLFIMPTTALAGQ